MNVKCAKDHMQQITKLCNDINCFEEKHEELNEETEFLSDVVLFLCDYRKVLENAVDRAKLDI